jgi:hypothetical protein
MEVWIGERLYAAQRRSLFVVERDLNLLSQPVMQSFSFSVPFVLGGPNV